MKEQYEVEMNYFIETIQVFASKNNVIWQC